MCEFDLVWLFRRDELFYLFMNELLKTLKRLFIGNVKKEMFTMYFLKPVVD